jgi:hypothetical protein
MYLEDHSGESIELESGECQKQRSPVPAHPWRRLATSERWGQSRGSCEGDIGPVWDTMMPGRTTCVVDSRAGHNAALLMMKILAA